MNLRRLLPTSGTVAAAAALSGLDLGALAPAERPYVVVNFAATADGKATIGGRSGPIGDSADRALFHRLRTQVDAVLAGPGTLRVERYGRLVRDPELRAARVAEGLTADPLAATVSRGLDLPVDEIPLFADPESRIVVYTASDAPLAPCAARVEVVRRAALPDALADLRAHQGVRSVLCEGGPILFGALLGTGLVDELFLSLSPRLAGGGERSVSEGPRDGAADLRLLSALEHEGSLFLRYAVVR